ncbi:tripartite tricarboxylate transporter substrate binding protein [Verticiella sediminum]|uniref:Tripartite tricarboxylate transporter substrate binding protein n=1 Tax=Verticiella sediminum TaxID=1247510 RepID=A0A556A6E4_9BURK|nr:tripartite tricarboxylate transporter substrate binding protein [Verticiella sediminum]TSH88448.1 tripartite tricarboxylate transporter substrate binding protein [Verticiella sediminum]
MFSQFSRRALAALVSIAALAAPTVHAAESWKPEKPVRLLVGFAPGGSADTLARLLSEPLGQHFGVPIVVENIAGAGGNIMASRLANAAPDGYTLGIAAAGSMAITHVLNAEGTPYKAADFTPITLAAVQPNVVIVNNDVPASNIAELKTYFEQNPQATYGTAGIGISNHLIAETMLHRMGVKVEHAAYRGASPVIVDLLGGHIAMTVDNISTAAALAREGKVKALAVTSAERAPQLPEVPTLAEQGLTGFDMPTWQGVFAPAGLAPEIRDAYYAALQDVLVREDVIERMATLGSQPVTGMTPAQFEDYLEADRLQWAQTAEDADIRLQ